ncbi:MAG: GNAT family N-acetyltransferase [Gillisia sp.]
MEDRIQHKESEKNGMFYIEDQDGIVAELNYTRQDNGIMVIDHTETEKRARGKGLAAKLLKKSVDFARAKNLKIDPLCDFAQQEFEKHEEYRELQAE